MELLLKSIAMQGMKHKKQTRELEISESMTFAGSGWVSTETLHYGNNEGNLGTPKPQSPKWQLKGID